MDGFFNPVINPEEARVFAEPGVTPLERSLGAQALAALHKHYPGWTWMVEIRGGCLIVRNLDCDTRGKYGFAKHISMLSGANIEAGIMRAGGEFLERYNQQRQAKSKGDAPYAEMIFEAPAKE